MRLTLPGARKMRISLFWVDIGHVHYNPPRTALLLPDANVAPSLDHVLCVVSMLVSAVCVTEIAGARHVAVDWLPGDLALGLGQHAGRSVTADVWKISGAIKSNFRRGVHEKRLRESVLNLIVRILSIAIKQCLARAIDINRLERNMFVRVSGIPQRLWST